MKLKGAFSLKEKFDKPRQHIKKQSITLPTNVHIVKAMFFSSSHVQTLELDHKEGFAEELMLSNFGAG